MEVLEVHLLRLRKGPRHSVQKDKLMPLVGKVFELGLGGLYNCLVVNQSARLHLLLDLCGFRVCWIGLRQIPKKVTN